MTFGRPPVLGISFNFADPTLQALYASQLLYIVTNALTKCAVSLLLARIVFIKSRVRACYAVLGISALWGVGSFLAQAIRCTEFPPWQLVGGSCSNNVRTYIFSRGLEISC